MIGGFRLRPDFPDTSPEEVRRIDFVLRTHEVCGYALVVSLTAIMLSGDQRAQRLGLFRRALDAFEEGAFDSAMQCARAAAAPVLGTVTAECAEDPEAMRARLHRLLSRPPGTA